MRHLNRLRSAASKRRTGRTRIVALIATFLLLVAGVLVSAPGLISASASGGTSSDEVQNEHQNQEENDNECQADTDGQDGNEGHDGNAAQDENQVQSESQVDDQSQQKDEHGDKDADGDDDDDESCVATLTVFKTIGDDTHGGSLTGDDFQLLVDGVPQAQNVPVQLPADVHIVSEVQQPGYKLQAITCTDDITHAAVKNYDGAVDLAPGQHVTCNVINDDIAPTITMHKIVVNDNGGTAQPQDFQMTINSNNTIKLDTPYPVTANKANLVSETGSVPGYVATMIQCTSDIPGSRNNLTVPDSGTAGVIPVLAENIDCTITNDDVPTGLTVVKHVQNDDGGNAVVADFPLQVNGAEVTSGQPVPAQAGVAMAISETQQSGYIATDVTCVSSDPNSTNNLQTPSPQPAALATVTLSATESVMCTITNDDIAPTVTVHKSVVGGTAVAGAFQMTLAGAPVNQDVPIAATANQPLEVSEVPVAGYNMTSVVCTDNDAGQSPVVHPLVLNEGQNVTCTVTNTFAAPMITVVKAVTNNSGGALTPADFQLTLDGAAVAQGSAIEVQPGAHVVAEAAKAGYAQTGIVCTDNATNATVGTAGSVDIAVGQHLTCTVSNDDIPATLKLVKQLIANNGGQADPASFQLQIDNVNVPQLTAQPLSAGIHTIGEVVVPGWKLTSITCTDDVTKVPVSYSAGITLALDQHVTCNVFNDDLPIDLAITKTDGGVIQVAGGAPFDYTITVRNLGPGDPAIGAVVTVTDQLPVGFDFVAFPATCTAVGQTLTCPILATDLQSADAPVVFTVSVKAHPDIASGTYTNKAFVDTAADPACVGIGCVPVCGASDNNVACQATGIRREASITIDKHDDVAGAITPGTTYNYIITVTNPGPSTFLGGLTVIDDLPLDLSLVSVDGGGQWSCAPVDPVICTFGLDLQPGQSTAAITIKVTLDPNFRGTTVFNQATATATVDPPVPPAAALRTQATTGAPGTVVTATDDETTSVVRNSDMAIVKSVSQTTAAPGGEFNWVLDVTNNGPQTATNVVVNDSIPAAFEVVGAFPASGLNCTNTTSAVQCTAAALASGATVRVTIQVRLVAGAAAGTITNTATVSSDSVDSDPSNNTSSASIDVSAAASLAPVPPAQTPPANTQLPRTGNDSGEPLRLAGLMFISGALAIYVARRRRSIPAQ